MQQDARPLAEVLDVLLQSQWKRELSPEEGLFLTTPLGQLVDDPPANATLLLSSASLQPRYAAVTYQHSLRVLVAHLPRTY